MSKKGVGTPSVNMNTREVKEKGLQEGKRELAEEAGRDESMEEVLSVLLGSSDGIVLLLLYSRKTCNLSYYCIALLYYSTVINIHFNFLVHL